MSKKGNDSRRFVILGGGVAGLSAAETLRQVIFFLKKHKFREKKTY